MTRNRLDLLDEHDYSVEVGREHRKKLGQFFTPPTIADLMVSWINTKELARVLDPSFGSGVLVQSCRNAGVTSDIDAFEVDPKIHNFFKRKFESDKKLKLTLGDYLSSSFSDGFDGVIANPPYIRHHDFEIHQKCKDLLERSFGAIPKTSNIYVYFVLKIILDLKPTGKAAIIIPSDWLNSNFGRSFKSSLFGTGYVSKIIYFKNDIDPFEDNLSTATILLIDKSVKRSSFEIAVVGQDSDSFLTIGQKIVREETHEAIRSFEIDKLDPSQKWGPIFEGNAKNFPASWISMSELFNSRRGIATGANSYFLQSKEQIRENGLSLKRSKRCVGRSKDVQGLIFTEEDFKHCEQAGSPMFLLELDEKYEEDKRYIESGREQDLPSRFLLANRTPWYKQESRPIAEILVGVFGRDGVRFVWNKARTYNLTTFHGLYADLTDDEHGVVVALLNSSLLQVMNKGSERSYGGGLQKVEPKDLLEMSIPDPRTLGPAIKDQLLRALLDADECKRKGVVNWRGPIDSVVSSNLDSLGLID